MVGCADQSARRFERFAFVNTMLFDFADVDGPAVSTGRHVGDIYLVSSVSAS